MRTEDFDYHLPEELVASRPLPDRAASRMMLVDRRTGSISHHAFAEFPDLFPEDALAVFNDTRVVPARFFSDDGKKEILWLETLADGRWRCMVKPGRKLREGKRVEIAGIAGTVEEVLESGERLIRFSGDPPDPEIHGHLALPHYMGRGDEPADRDRYQTVYARDKGSVAAPTAGLHFTPEIVARIPHTFLTLHVGPGTFQPVRVDKVEEHRMHSERYLVSQESADRIKLAEKVVSIGTTTARVLEHLASEPEGINAGAGETEIFIYPGFTFRRVDALLTNFHLPKSTLLMLVSALAGTDLIRKAYEEAVRERYRFYSYGDCMFIC